MLSVGINMKDFHEQNINLPALRRSSNMCLHQTVALTLTLLTKINISLNSFSIFPYYILVTEQSMIYVLSHLILQFRHHKAQSVYIQKVRHREFKKFAPNYIITKRQSQHSNPHWWVSRTHIHNPMNNSSMQSTLILLHI